MNRRYSLRRLVDDEVVFLKLIACVGLLTPFPFRTTVLGGTGVNSTDGLQERTYAI